MTSVPSHRLRLNGNKSVLISLVLCAVCACSTPKKAVVKPPAEVPPVSTEDKVPQYDPKTDEVILVPRDVIKTDTIKWIEDTTPPIVTDEVVRPDKPIRNEIAEIALLIPFNAINAPLFTEQLDPKLNRFVQYYAGISMAMDIIDSMALPVKVHTFDADPAITTVAKLMLKPEVKNADVIVGPYEKADLESLATFGLQNEIMVVSPWLPAFNTTTENPFFIQLYPGLSTHAEVITDFISKEQKGKKVYVVTRDNVIERNRVQHFTKNDQLPVEELIIIDSSPDLINTNLHELMSDEVGTIFILPYFSKADETFVNSFMRKLHADKDIREAIVFGLPQWVGYTNLNSNYMESLSLHLSISSFIDVASPDYTKFRNGFYKRYHTIPDLNAFLGYDLMMWLADRLSSYGQEGLIDSTDALQDGLASGFHIRPLYKQPLPSSAEMKTPLYYENQRIRILKFTAQDFVLVR